MRLFTSYFSRRFVTVTSRKSSGSASPTRLSTAMLRLKPFVMCDGILTLEVGFRLEISCMPRRSKIVGMASGRRRSVGYTAAISLQ